MFLFGFLFFHFSCFFVKMTEATFHFRVRNIRFSIFYFCAFSAQTQPDCLTFPLMFQESGHPKRALRWCHSSVFVFEHFIVIRWVVTTMTNGFEVLRSHLSDKTLFLPTQCLAYERRMDGHAELHIHSSHPSPPILEKGITFVAQLGHFISPFELMSSSRPSALTRCPAYQASTLHSQQLGACQQLRCVPTTFKAHGKGKNAKTIFPNRSQKYFFFRRERRDFNLWSDSRLPSSNTHTYFDSFVFWI